MSLVLIIIGLIITTLFPALTAVRTAHQRQATEAHLQTLMRATAAYVQANGCLPCPTPISAPAPLLGRVRGDTSNAACGGCLPTLAEGLPPFASLGLPASFAKDGWGRWIRMRVDPALTIAFNVTPPTLACTATDAQPCAVGTSQKGLCKAGLSPTNRIIIKTPDSFDATDDLQTKAAVLFISHGANGYGAPAWGKGSLGFPSGLGTCSALTPEACNADGTKDFVAPSAAAPNAAFDDILVYADRNGLVSLLGNGTCQTVW